MTALYNVQSINLPHVNLFKWAKEKKIWVPLDWRQTPDMERMFLKMVTMRQFYIKGTPAEEQARFSEAMKEAMKYLPTEGLSDQAVMIVQIVGTALVCFLVKIAPTIAKL